MNSNEFDELTWKEKVDVALEDTTDLDAECVCYIIPPHESRTHEGEKYTLTVNGNNTTEYSVYTWDEEEEVKLEDILDEYEVHDWTDLPFNGGGCKFCPERYVCDVAANAVEVFADSLD